MKVLMVTNMYPSAQKPHSGSFIKSQIDSIRREGIDVDVLYLDTKSKQYNYIKGWYTIFKKSWDQSFDLIHAHYGYCGMVSKLQFRLPVIVSYCGGDVLGSPNIKGEKTLFDKIMLPLGWILSMVVSAAIVKSQEMKDRLPRTQNIFVIPNGVDFDFFTLMKKSVARKKVGLAKNKKYILFPANPSWIRKCYPVAKEAVDILKQKGNNVELVVLHSKPQKTVPAYMNACDALVLTSYWEGSPNVIKEAMACNLPVVSVDVGDVAQILDGCQGCYIVKRDATDVAAKLEIVLGENRRTNGRECIQDLEIQTIARKIRRLYHKVVRK
jgi:teichuronic acid biosynthesis glycosyltransferase TuaC